MADPIQKIKDSMNRGITTISVKTSSSLEKSKINMHIDSLEKEIQGLFLTIGKESFDLWERGNTDLGTLADKFNAIRQKKAEIAQLTTERDAIDQRDNQILGTAPQNTAGVPQAAAAIFCPQCGSSYDTPVKFCRKCGCNLQNI